MNRQERKAYSKGRRRLMRRMVDEGLLVRTKGLFLPSARGVGEREIDGVIARLVRFGRRENQGGQHQILKDVLRVLKRKKPRYLDQTATGAVVLEVLRAIRKLPEVQRALKRAKKALRSA